MAADRRTKAAAKRAVDALLIVFEYEGLDGAERDEVSHVRFVCQEIEDGEK